MQRTSSSGSATPIQIAQSHLQADRFDEARTIYQSLITAAPDRMDGYLLMSRLAFEEGHPEACLTNLRDALLRAPDSPKLVQHAIDRFRHFDQTDDALTAYDRLIALDPKAIKPRADRAHYLQILGRFDAAEKAFRKLLKAAPNEAELYRMALPTLSLKPADPLRKQMAKLWANKALPNLARMHLGFAMAQAEQDPDREFALLTRANAAQKQAAPFDRAAMRAEYEAVLAAQRDLPDAPATQQTPHPIFVIGTPRSGTTLVEQILGAHSDVATGGELRHGLALAYKHFGAAQAMRPPDPAGLQNFANRYTALLARDGGAHRARVTDKSITTHLIMGLLRTALPGARFVVVQRDPRDIALSIFRNHFALGTHRYSADFADIAFVIKAFRKNIAHWQTVMPDAIHTIRYEDLVSDPDPQSRALIAAVGLDWEDACLRFHTRKGAVQTLSLAQVRQPIHAGRKQAWRKYEQHLQPFIAAWGDEPWD